MSKSQYFIPSIIALGMTLVLAFAVSRIYSKSPHQYDPETFAATRTVRTLSELQTAIREAAPGATIEIEDAIFTQQLNISDKSGSVDKPITIRAKNSGKVVIDSGGQLNVVRSKHLILQGFKITSYKYNPVLIDNSENIRISGNYFAISESTSKESVWVYVKGNSKHIRIDHNDFRDKRGLGRYIAIHGDGRNMAQYTKIDHNYFKNIGPRAENGKETIQIGLAEYTYSPAYTTVEYNLFEECNGDPEIISVKSSNNKIQFNTFNNNRGMVVLRHGNSSTIEGNLFFGNVYGSGGVRVHGQNHRVASNYFENLLGVPEWAAITIPQGNEDEGSTNLKGHFRAVNIRIENNVISRNDYSLTLGNGSSIPPKNVSILNNIFFTNRNRLITLGKAENTLWSGNSAKLEGGASLGTILTETQLRRVNLDLKPFDQDAGQSIKKYLPELRRTTSADVGPQALPQNPQASLQPISSPTPQRSLIPSPTAQQGSTSTLQIVANGKYTTVAPIMGVYLNDNLYQKFTVSNTTPQSYIVNFNTAVVVNQLKVSFENDGENRDLRVERIILNGLTYESTAPTVYSTGTWSSDNGCKPGYKKSVWLNCPGYLQYQ